MNDGTISLASYKLRLLDAHVRAVPERGLDGCPFEGPGVDLRGSDAAAAIDAARPLLEWLDAREPGVTVRSVSVSLRLRARGPRVLVSLGAAAPGERPRAVRFDAPHADELRDAGRAAERVIGEACARALARRAAASR